MKEKLQQSYQDLDKFWLSGKKKQAIKLNVQELELHSDQLTVELKETHSELDQTKTVLVKTEEDLTGTKENLAQTQGELEKTSLTLKATESTLHTTQEELQQTHRELDQTKTVLVKTEEDLTGTKEDLAQTQGELEKTSTTLKETESTLHTTQEELQQTHTELDQTKTVLAKTEEDLTGTKENLAQTQGELEKTSSTLKETESTLHTTQEELQQTHRELDQTKTVLVKTEEDLTGTKENLAQTQGELEKTSTILKETESTLHNTQEELQQTHTELDQTKTVLVKTEEDLTGTKEDLAQTQGELEKTSSTLKATESTLHTTQEELQQTHRELDQTKTVLVKTEGDLSQTQEKLEETSEDLTQKEWTLKNTQKELLTTKTNLQTTILREKLVAALLNANQVSPALQEYFDALNNDFLSFANEEASLKEEAAALLKLQDIGEQLKLISANPAFYQKTVIGIAGGFSAGKSAFINSLIKDKNIKLATNINPTTAIPTYVLNGENQIKAVSSQGGVVNLDKIDPECHAKLSHQFISQFGFNLKNIMPQIFLSTPMHFEHICFIDTPGYDPAVMDSHYTSSDKETAETFAQQADALIWVIGLDSNGTIPHTDLNFLQNIVKQQEKPIYVVLNKADLRPPSDIEDILETVVELLEDYDIPVNGVCAYSSLDNEEIEYSGTSLWQFLKGLNKAVKKQDIVIKQLYEVDQMYQKAILAEQKSHKDMQNNLEYLGLALLRDGLDLGSDVQTQLDEMQALYNPNQFNQQLKSLEKVMAKLRNAIENNFGNNATVQREIVKKKASNKKKQFFKSKSRKVRKF